MAHCWCVPAEREPCTYMSSHNMSDHQACGSVLSSYCMICAWATFTDTVLLIKDEKQLTLSFMCSGAFTLCARCVCVCVCLCVCSVFVCVCVRVRACVHRSHASWSVLPSAPSPCMWWYTFEGAAWGIFALKVKVMVEKETVKKSTGFGSINRIIMLHQNLQLWLSKANTNRSCVSAVDALP